MPDREIIVEVTTKAKDDLTDKKTDDEKTDDDEKKTDDEDVIPNPYPSADHEDITESKAPYIGKSIVSINGVTQEEAIEFNKKAFAMLGNKAFKGTTRVYQAAGDTVSTDLVCKNSKVKEVKVDIVTGEKNVITVNANAKLNIGSGWSSISANLLSGAKNTIVDKASARLMRTLNKKSVMALKKIKAAEPYVLNLARTDGTRLKITVVDVALNKQIKKNTLSGSKTVSADSISENAVKLDGIDYAVSVSTNAITIGTSPAGKRFLSGIWTVGSGKSATNIPVGGVATRVAVSNKLSVYAWVDPNGNITVSPAGPGTGNIKLAYNLNGRIYKTSVKVK